MTELYTEFSNYDEINIENRRTAVKAELDTWGTDRTRFEEYRSEWKKSAESEYLPEKPLHVDIELSDACNFKCKMCAHGIGTVGKVGLMMSDVSKRLIDECAEIGVYSIKFNWRGEATLNSTLSDMVAYAKYKGILEVQINTNGCPPEHNEGVLIRCAQNGIDRIIFSIDGHSEETYSQIRVGGDYRRLVRNIHELIEWKKDNRADKPLIRLQMVRNIHNAHEVDDFISYWTPLVDDVRISDVMDRGQGGNLSVGDQKTIGRRRCPQPFQRLVIGRDGRVSPCCADWNQEYVVGNVHEHSLMEIWNNEKMSKMRGIQNAVKLDCIGICKNCYVKESYLWEKRKEVVC